MSIKRRLEDGWKEVMILRQIFSPLHLQVVTLDSFPLFNPEGISEECAQYLIRKIRNTVREHESNVWNGDTSFARDLMAPLQRNKL